MSIPFIRFYTNETKALTASLNSNQKSKIFDAILDYGLFEIWALDTENNEKFLYISEQIKEQVLKFANEYKEVCKRNKRIAKRRKTANPDDTTRTTTGSTTGAQAVPPLVPPEDHQSTSKHLTLNTELLTLNSKHLTLNTNTMFEDFWRKYPKQTTKRECEKWWSQNPEKRTDALAGLDWYAKSDRARSIQYCLDPIRYLKREIWKDDPAGYNNAKNDLQNTFESVMQDISSQQEETPLELKYAESIGK